MAHQAGPSGSDSEEDERRQAAVKRKLESLQALANAYEAERPPKAKQAKLSDFVAKLDKGTTSSASIHAGDCWADPEPNLHIYTSAGVKHLPKVSKFLLLFAIPLIYRVSGRLLRSARYVNQLNLYTIQLVYITSYTLAIGR